MYYFFKEVKDETSAPIRILLTLESLYNNYIKIYYLSGNAKAIK